MLQLPIHTVKALRYDLSYTFRRMAHFPLVGPKDLELGFFVQDKWRVKPNFTLIYGLRVDIPIFQEYFPLQSIGRSTSQFYNGIHLNTGQAPHVNPLFGPRLGFNWDVKGDQKTQVRGGVGFFAGPPPFVWISNQASNSGVALVWLSQQFNDYFFQSGCKSQSKLARRCNQSA